MLSGDQQFNFIYVACISNIIYRGAVGVTLVQYAGIWLVKSNMDQTADSCPRHFIMDASMFHEV